MTTERIEFQLSPEDRAAMAQFVEANPGIEKLKPIARENLFLESRIIQAGGDPTSATGQGVGDEALRSRNEALKRRLATLQTPLRQGGPTVGEVRQSIPEPGIGTTESGARRFALFPNAGTEAATGLNPIVPIAGFTQEAAAEASPFVRFAMNVFNDLTAPATIISAGLGPAAAASTRLGGAAASGSRPARAALGLLGETPQTAALAEIGGSVGANAAEAAGLSTPLQIAAGFAGGVGGAAAPVLTRTAVNQGQKAALGAAGAVADRVPAQLDRVSPVGVARAAGPEDIPEPSLPRDPLPPEDLDIIRRQIDNQAVRQSGRVPDSSIDRVVQTTRRIARNEPETPASVIDDQLLQLEEDVAAARIRQEISGGSTPPPRKPGEPLMGGGDVPPPRRPERGLSDDLELPVHEKPQQGIFRKWSGARNVERLSIEQWFRRGEDTLRKAGIKRADEHVAEMRDLFRALHGEISPEQLRRSLRPVYDDLRRLVDQETKDMADFLAQAKEADASLFGLDADNFTATMMAHPDYFPRGWRIPRNQPGVSSGRTGTRPGFTRPRVDASFSELLESGLLPASWDPYAMMARRRLAGVEYRETIRLIHRLKERGLVVGAAEAPEGWRVPRVGPAFEGRPVGIAEDGNTIFSKRLAVPNNRREGFIARELEGLFGSGEDISHLDWLRKISNSLKRMKLIGSAFQHVDISTRALGAGLTPTSIRHGGAFKTPALVTEMFKAQWWPAARRKFRSDLLSTEPWYSDFDISSRMLIEEGWNVQGDLSVINRQFLDFIEDSTRDLPAGIKSLKKLNDFWEQGLFEGVYSTSQKFALREHLVPSIRRQHPDWTPRQVAAQAAENVNIMFSSQDKWQTVFRLAGAEMREVTRALIFSTNESEGLIKSAIRAMNPRSPHFQQFAEWYAGTFLALAGIANLIHYTATGKVLPKESYNPINADDPYAPFGVGYSNRFLSPEMPFVRGRNNTAVYADLVGQMDTAFRWGLDPMSALSARTNVIPRALQNQLGSGTNFFGEPLQTPGQRVGQAVLDLGAPIGVQNAVGAASEQFPPLQQAFPPAESRLGATGQLFQASGINLRSPVNAELRELLERRPEMKLEIEAELERRQVEFARRSPDSLFTNVLKARLRQAREQGDALAIRAIEIELRNRGELEESSSEPVAPATPTPQPVPARNDPLPARRIEN